MDFPQYRKLFNERSFYRIRSDRSFDEIQLIGSKAYFHRFEVEKYPELVRIQEMLEFSHGFANSTKEEFEELLQHHAL